MRTGSIAILCLLAPTLVVQASEASKRGAPTLTILEIGQSGDLKWSDVRTPVIEVPLTFENPGNSAVSNLVVEITPFATLSASAKAQLNGQPSLKLPTLKPHDRAVVRLSATLVAAGTYRARLTVRRDILTILSVPIEIGRTRAAAPIEIAAVPAREIELGVLPRPGSTTFSVKVNGTGEPVDLDAPVARSVEYRESADAKTATAAPADVTFEPAAPFRIDGVRPVDLAVTVGRVDTAGRYDVSVAVGGPAFTPTVATFVVYARQGWPVALGSIFVGLLLSWFLRYYSVVGRPSLANKQRATRLFRELDEDAALANDDPHAVALVQDVRRKLSERWDALSLAGKLTDADSLTVWEARVGVLPLWLQLWKRVASLKPPDVASKFRAKLIAIELVLRDRNADLKTVNEQASALDRMPAEIDEEIRTTLRAQIDGLLAQTKQDPRFAELEAEASRLAGETAAARADLATLPERVDQLQRRYFRRVADDLAAMLTSPPVGVGASWSATVATIGAHLARVRTAATAADASEAFRLGVTLYVRTSVDGLLIDLAQKLGEGKETSQKSRYAAEYQIVQDKLKAIAPLLEAGQVTAAWEALRDAQARYIEIRKLADPGSMGAAASVLAVVTSLGTSAPAAAQFDVSTIALGRSASDEVTRPGAYEALRGQQLLGDIVTNVLIALAALLAGLQTLWIGNPTWGGTRSMLEAFLWGLAFDQFSYAGVVALIKRR